MQKKSEGIPHILASPTHGEAKGPQIESESCTAVAGLSKAKEFPINAIWMEAKNETDKVVKSVGCYVFSARYIEEIFKIRFQNFQNL